MTRVAILGGGVAGLTAAHELAERGFEADGVAPRNLPARGLLAAGGVRRRRA
jgi:glycine/D-amino acid oxidase-like deaminating enzyme